MNLGFQDYRYTYSKTVATRFILRTIPTKVSIHFPAFNTQLENKSLHLQRQLLSYRVDYFVNIYYNTFLGLFLKCSVNIN